MMFWLLVTWIVYFDLLLPGRRRSVRERRLFGPRLSAPEEIVLVGFAAYMLFKVATTAVQYMDLGSAISEARIPLYMFAGYFLLRGILCHAGRKETVDFLAAIVVVNTIAAGLYVLHQGLHMYIYVGRGGVSSTFVFNGEVLTRSFYFMPQYLPLAIAFCVAKRKWNLSLARRPRRDAGRHLGVLHACAGPRRDRRDRGDPRRSSPEAARCLAGRQARPADRPGHGRVRRRSGHPAAHPVRLSLLPYRRDPVAAAARSRTTICRFASAGGGPRTSGSAATTASWASDSRPRLRMRG